ncbi:MAG: hypothetical protein WAL29_00365 [Bacteroidales bacterium]
MRYPVPVLLFLFLSMVPVSGQEKSDTSSSSEKLYFNFRNVNFIRNNEYSNPVTEGYTLIGYFLHPELIYHPSAKVTLRLGTHLLSYAGTNKFSVIKPLFSTTYNFSENTSITIGSLSANYKNELFDPHYNRERLYTNYSEDGLQLRFFSDHFLSDTWLSWENYIFKGDSEREIFSAGESFKYSSPLIADLIRLEVPLQLQFKHFGGQISDYPEQTETYLNFAGGVRVSFDLGEQKYGKTGFEYLIFRGNSLRRNAPSGINYGRGEWHKIFYIYKIVDFNAGYWTSHDFYAPEGNFIFSSVSDHIENVTVHIRKIITGSVNITLLPESFLELYFAFDGYYDMDRKRMDNAVTLHLRFDKLFRLGSLKQH